MDSIGNKNVSSGHVLFVMNYPSSTGMMWNRAIQTYERAAEILKLKGVKSFIAYPRLDSVKPKKNALTEIELDCNCFSSANGLLIREFIIQQRIDLVIYIDKSFIWKYVSFFRKLNVRTIMYSRYGLDLRELEKNKIKSYIRKVIHLTGFYSFDHYIVINSNAKNKFPKCLGISGEKISLISNGIDMELIKERGGINFDFEKYHGRKIILSVFQLRKEKNIGFIIQLAKVLIAKRRDVVFIHVGSGEQLPYAKKLVFESGLTEQFIFAGEQVNVFPFFEQAHVFVHACLIECFGNIFCESMLSGVPVVTVESDGARDQITNEVGIIVHSLDENEFIYAIEKYLDNTEVRELVKVKGPDRVKRNFSKETQAKNLTNLFLNNLSKGMDNNA